MASEVYSLEEVKKHSTSKDLWIVAFNHVYDVTEYQQEHPGGKEFLIENAGTDATVAYEDVGHSTDAREVLENYRIGKLKDEEWTDYAAAKVPQVTPSGVHVANTVSSSKHISHVPIIGVGLVTVTIAVVLGKRYSNLLPEVDEFGFWKGFFVSSVASLGLAAYATKSAIQKMSVSDQQFQAYPAHKKSKQIARPIGLKKSINLGVLNPREYQQYPLVKKFKLSHDSYRFIFGLPSENSVLGLPTGQHIAIRHEIDGKQVSRSYTPTSSNKDLGRLELTIKVYPDGALTPYLERLNVGDKIEIRGPKGEMKYHKNLSKNIGMIAGGTGVTPLYQIIRRICEDPRDDTKMTFLFSNKTEEDILMRKELETFAADHSDQFKLYHVLSKPSKDWKGMQGTIDKKLIQKYLPAPAGDDSKILMCGSGGMMAAMKKHCVELGFKEPGKISNSRDEIFSF